MALDEGDEADAAEGNEAYPDADGQAMSGWAENDDDDDDTDSGEEGDGARSPTRVAVAARASAGVGASLLVAGAEGVVASDSDGSGPCPGSGRDGATGLVSAAGAPVSDGSRGGGGGAARNAPSGIDAGLAPQRLASGQVASIASCAGDESSSSSAEAGEVS